MPNELMSSLLCCETSTPIRNPFAPKSFDMLCFNLSQGTGDPVRVPTLTHRGHALELGCSQLPSPHR